WDDALDRAVLYDHDRRIGLQLARRPQPWPDGPGRVGVGRGNGGPSVAGLGALCRLLGLQPREHPARPDPDDPVTRPPGGAALAHLLRPPDLRTISAWSFDRVHLRH